MNVLDACKRILKSHINIGFATKPRGGLLPDLDDISSLTTPPAAKGCENPSEVAFLERR